ncbi:MAG TPA: winged helix DNA-binding domain-containing protein [Candidatus Limnocylindrales bacterium]
MNEPVLSVRALNRALLARQLLLERASMPIAAAVEHVGGLQTQYAPSGYVGLWTRLDGFERDALTRALEDRSVIQATLMRVTIHIVSRREYWAYALGVRSARREMWRRTFGRATGVGEPELAAAAGRLREALTGGPRDVKELGDLAKGFVGTHGLWVDLVRVPPAGTWHRRRADRLALAEDWVGPPDTTEEDGLTHLVRAYLRAFGPATWADIASWAGITATAAKAAAAGLELRGFRDESGRALIDLPGGPLPDPATPAPVRFLPHWDANLLVHTRRTGLLPEPFRSRVFSTKNPFSVGTYLVDGSVAGAWSVRDGRVVLDPFVEVPATVQREIDREREALEAFHA